MITNLYKDILKNLIIKQAEVGKKRPKIKLENLKNKVICAKAEKLLALLPDNSVDLVLTDPCYGIDYIGQLKRKLGGKRLSVTKYHWNDYGAGDSKGFNDEKRTSPELINECLRVGKNSIIWGGNYFGDILPTSQCFYIWNKCQRKFSMADCEQAWASFNKAARIFDYARSQYISDEAKRFHPTQKPIKLFEWCIMQARLKPGATVLDPFCGSATTAIACINLGYNYICADEDANMIKQAQARVEDRLKQPNLFKAEEIVATNLSLFDLPTYETREVGNE